MARGSIRKRSPGSYELRWDAPKGEDGKRRVRQKTVQGNKKAAETELNRIFADLSKSDAKRDSEEPVQECYRRFLDERAGQDLRPGTVRKYNSFFKNYALPECGGIPLARVDRTVLQRIIQRMIDSRLKPETISANHGCLAGFFSWVVQTKSLTNTPVKGLTLPECSRESSGVVLSAAEVRALLTLFENTPYWLPTYLAVYTGMRPGEILGLSWEDVNLDQGFLSVAHTLNSGGESLNPGGESLNPGGKSFFLGPPKTKSSKRRVAVSPEVVRVLQDRKQKMPENFWYQTREKVGDSLKCLAVPVDFPQVCSQPDGKIVRHKAWEDAFRSKLLGADLDPIRPHDMRHTHASLLLLDGMPMHVVSRRLGHARIQTTINLYAHLLPSSDPEAAGRFEAIIETES